ncbi:class I SAM-dependent methyltransferase [Novosphingobium album (ex Liu et al. 2023)]|uniref:Class I SAM-dependent methyltransferase n=1 Tax=Novosphingobium album (ex Liu et al. 2023) TaxID=3031130 RepID=A0ABT5WQ76_9SPHN|nr:class I SAM-dependent methyltransferase [Novosphingobium album (ex Liu et al. 2023)]MDE8652205.1 class I SAM-dependent methyltransferase [Novosphingobium album (ex Liu et al. 2023)]
MSESEFSMTQPAGALGTIFGCVSAHWPEHASFLQKSLAGRENGVVAVSECLGAAIVALASTIEGGLDKLASDYRFLCEEIVMPEEIHFRRFGSYRLTSFADAQRECYANDPFMERYMNGLLLSNVLWANHANAFAYYVTRYLPRLPMGAHHLEIGPGHGLFLHFAAAKGKLGRIAGWDVSPTSIAKTRHALDTLGTGREIELIEQDLFAACSPRSQDRFDSIVMSEILEHLEDPAQALRCASRWLKPGGLLWINVPANSPAPDHIYLFESLDHAQRIAEEAGLEVVDARAFPMSGVTIERAVKHRLSVSCSLLTRAPA